jgi:hypothetical protein
MFEDRDLAAEAGRKSTVSSTKAAESRLQHGLFARRTNYYANLEDREQQFLDSVLEIMVTASNAKQDDSNDAIFARSVIRDAIIDMWRTKQFNESDRSDDDRLAGEARRLRRMAVDDLRDYGLLADDETSIERYYPGSAGMYGSKQ